MRLSKGKSIFPSDDALLKMLYLATQDVTRKMGRANPELMPDPPAVIHLFFGHNAVSSCLTGRYGW